MSNVRGVIVALLVFGSSSPLVAQMPGNKFEPINHLGRALGIGWSDGYSECAPSYLDRLSNLKASRSNVVTQSQLYETATFPPAGHAHLGLLPNRTKLPCNCPMCASLNEQPTYAAPVYSQPSIISQDPSMMPMQQPAVSPQGIPVDPSQDALAPIPNTFVPLDSVPTPKRLVPSPSDNGPSLNPIDPAYEPEPIPAQPNSPTDLQKPPIEVQKAPTAPKAADEDSLLLPDEAAMLRRYRAQRMANRYTPLPSNRYSR